MVTIGSLQGASPCAQPQENCPHSLTIITQHVHTLSNSSVSSYSHSKITTLDRRSGQHSHLRPSTSVGTNTTRFYCDATSQVHHTQWSVLPARQRNGSAQRTFSLLQITVRVNFIDITNVNEFSSVWVWIGLGMTKLWSFASSVGPRPSHFLLAPIWSRYRAARGNQVLRLDFLRAFPTIDCRCFFPHTGFRPWHALCVCPISAHPRPTRALRRHEC